MFRTILLCLSSALCGGVLSAQKYTISGYVSDKRTQEKLIGALVMNARSRAGTTTNNYGFYSLTIPKDSVTLIFSYLGFKPVRKDILLSANMTINADLIFDTELKTVEVVAGDGDDIAEKSTMSTMNIPIEQM